MRTRRPPILLVLVPILALILAACGSAPSGGGSTGQTTDSGAVAPAPKNASAPAPGAPLATPAAARAAGGAPAAEGARDGNTAKPAEPATDNQPSAALPLDQKIIKTGQIDVIVSDIGSAMRAVTTMTQAANGYLQQSATRDQNNVTIAEVVLRVPVDRYDDVFQQLRDLAVPDTKPSEQSTAQDVTEQYADIDARIRNLKATEEQLLRLLARAERIEDILTVQRELTGVREQIERLQGQLNVLERRAAFSTITATLRPQEIKRPAPPSPLQPAQAATEIPTRPLFRWSLSEGASLYQLQVTTEVDTAFATPLLDRPDLAATSYEWTASDPELRPGVAYRWRVRGTNQNGEGQWSPARTFSTVPVWNPFRTVEASWVASLKFLQGFVDTALAAIVFFWWLIPLLALLLLGLRGRVGRRPATPAATASTPAPPAP